ncbi:hypothetical protein, partial [Clostridium sp.]|uniref:hypothetical protein n=1 Tax=Clostridium sp. TaxID=1506 RepID=UPI003F2D6247
MLQLTFLELFIRTIPESFLFVFAVYAFSNVKVDKKKYILASTTLALTVFVIRELPISYGVHTLLNIMALIIIATTINKIDIIKSIKSGIITAVLLFVCEGVNIFLLQCIFQEEMMIRIFENPALKTIYGVPSLFVFAGTV